MHQIWGSKSACDMLQSSGTFLPVLSRAYTLAGAATKFTVPAASPAGFMIPSAQEGQKPVAMYSPEYYRACFIGGSVACSLTHTSITPLDVVKCNMQTDTKRFPTIPIGFRVTWAEQGLSGLVRGWLPTFIGYGIQGAGKFGFYEVFKKLCPLEAVKVKVQTVPGFAKGLSDGQPKIVHQEGFAGLYKGLPALWGRQIPYTMMKFGVFENVVTAMYSTLVPKPKEECSRTEQLGVSFAAGYVAGIACAIISQPADNLVSKLNAVEGSTVGGLIKEIGWSRLFLNGLPLRIVMIGTLTGAQWGIYDSWKVWAGLPTTGGH